MKIRGIASCLGHQSYSASTQNSELIMASEGRVHPPHHRHPLPNPYASAIHPTHGAFPPFEMLPPEVMAHKLSAQHVEIDKLATENQRLAATHGTLRQNLVASKHDLRLIHAHIADVKSENEQQTRGIIYQISKMESELEGAESIKMELQQARGEARASVSAREDLISKGQQLTLDLQIAHSEAQQIPPLMAEFDNLRKEYHHSRATYDYDKKLYDDHLESLLVIEKKYMAMSREVEKLKAELMQGQFSGYGGYNESALKGNYASAQTYGVGQQGQGPLLGGNSPNIVVQSDLYGSGTVPDAPRAPTYPTFLGTSYDPHVGAGYKAWRVQTGASFEAQRGPTGPGYEAQKGPGYDGQNAPIHAMQRGSEDDVEQEKGAAYVVRR